MIDIKISIDISATTMKYIFQENILVVKYNSLTSYPDILILINNYKLI